MVATLPQVLVYEPIKGLQDLLSEQLKGEIQILPAATLLEAEKLYGEWADICAIVVTVANDTITKIEDLVIGWKTYFEGPIIVVGKEHIRKRLGKVGVIHECEAENLHRELPRILKELKIL